MDLGLEPEFHDFTIQRAAADFEHLRRLLLVPADRLEHADDVGALGMGQ